jgi:hypothetical protein
MKTYAKVVLENGSIVYKIRDELHALNVVFSYSSISKTFIGLQFKFFNDSLYYVMQNDWLLSLASYNVEAILKEQGFTEREPLEYEIQLIRNSDI